MKLTISLAQVNVLLKRNTCFRKIKLISDLKHLHRKMKVARFFTAFNQSVFSWDMKKSFENVHLVLKKYWISSASLWNSTTVTTLMHVWQSWFSLRLFSHIKFWQCTLLTVYALFWRNHLRMPLEIKQCARTKFVSRKRKLSCKTAL